MSDSSFEQRRVEDLTDLKEGSIYVDNNGKKFRVKKTVFPQSNTAGPFGEGDPNDRTLRKLEADVIIPNRMNREIETNVCNTDFLNLVDCMRKNGSFLGLWKCKSILKIFNNCKENKFHDLDFRQKVTQIYLDERAEIRKTGKTKKMNSLEEFREWKANQENLLDKDYTI